MKTPQIAQPRKPQAKPQAEPQERRTEQDGEEPVSTQIAKAINQCRHLFSFLLGLVINEE